MSPNFSDQTDRHIIIIIIIINIISLCRRSHKFGGAGSLVIEIVRDLVETRLPNTCYNSEFGRYWSNRKGRR